MNPSLSFTEAIDFYLKTRRALGVALKTEETHLRSLARYAQQVQAPGPLTAALALAWAQLPQRTASVWWARRLGIVRRLARFWQAFDPQVQVPPAGVFGPGPRRRPVHIYTPGEISDLLAATATLGPARSLRPATFRTLLGLLACTGLRVSEAVQLQSHDFDPVAGTLLIRRAKGGQSRYVPLQSSAVAALQAYRRRRQAQAPQPRSPAFFLTHKGRPLSAKQAGYAFRRLRQQLGWTQVPRPRLHDLRHTFAVARLLAWQRRGHTAVDRKILALATYLGHRNIHHTYWYLSAVPALLALASQRLPQVRAREGRA